VSVPQPLAKAQSDTLKNNPLQVFIIITLSYLNSSTWLSLGGTHLNTLLQHIILLLCNEVKSVIRRGLPRLGRNLRGFFTARCRISIFLLVRPVILSILMLTACSQDVMTPDQPIADANSCCEDASPLSADSANMTEDSGINLDSGSERADARPPNMDAASMQPETFLTETFDGMLTYATAYSNTPNTTREVKIRVYYPIGVSWAVPVIIVSHGGSGSMQGHTSFSYLGNEYASHAYLSIHLNHNASQSNGYHRWDRPHDVKAVVSALLSGNMPMNSGFAGTIDPERIGHIGHSWGAYTAHAVGGANFTNPVRPSGPPWNFREMRIKAFAALSPQGFGGFGTFDAEEDITKTSTSNSWMDINIPAFNLIGERELDGIVGIENPQNCPECFRADDWRLFPYMRYPADGTKYVAVLPGQTHSDLGNQGAEAVKKYIAENTRVFFDVYLKGETNRQSEIGQKSAVSNIDFRSK